MRRLTDLCIGAAAGATVATVGPSAASTPFLGPVAISPSLYPARFRNERVRVLEHRLPPGVAEPMHRHRPGLLLALADGAHSSHAAKAGDVSGREAPTHAVENPGRTDARDDPVELEEPPR